MKKILFFLLFLPIFCFSQTGNPRLQPTKPFAMFYRNGFVKYLAPGTNGQVIKMSGDTSVVWGTDQSGSVTDGNYTDVTVSGGGLSWTINANAVTNSKIAAATIDSSRLAVSAITSTRLANGSVWMSKISQAGASAGNYLGWTGSAWAPSFPFSGATNRIPYFSGVNSLSNSGNFTYDNTNAWFNLNTYTSGNNGGYAGLQATTSAGALYLRSGNNVASNVVEGGSIICSRGGASVLSGNCTTTYDYLGALHAQAFYSSAFREAATIQFRGDSTASTFYSGNISFWTSDGTATAAERMRLNKAGNLGIGNTNPLYRLDVAGTGAIRLPTGTSAQRPTAAAGVIRHNTDLNKFEGSGTGATYYPFDQTLLSATSNTTINNTTAVSTLTSVSIPANSLSSGQTLRIMAEGYIQTDATTPGNLRVGLVYGTDTIYSATAGLRPISGGAFRTFTANFSIRVSAAGASGTMRAQGFAQMQTALVDPVFFGGWFPFSNPVLSDNTGINTTTTKTLALFAQFGTALAANGIVITNATILRQ